MKGLRLRLYIIYSVIVYHQEFGQISNFYFFINSNLIAKSAQTCFKVLLLYETISNIEVKI